MNNAVSVRDVRKSYGGQPVVDGVSFDVAAGETFGLLGPNGAGKTTTLERVLGVRKPDAGSAAILGMDPRAQRKELFQRVGVQFQEARYQDRDHAWTSCAATTRALYARRPIDPAPAGSLVSAWPRCAPQPGGVRCWAGSGSACSWCSPSSRVPTWCFWTS